MKRIGGDIMERIASIANIEAAVDESRRHRGKRNALTVASEQFLKNRAENVALIRESLLSGNMPEITYRTFVRKEHKKRRRIDWNPSFRDNVVQHAIVRVLGPLLVAKMIPDTYSGIKGRGPSYGLYRLREHVRGFDGHPFFVMKMDIRQFYPSINTRKLKRVLRRYIKSRLLLKILDGIIDSHPDGLPIGNYISQLLANLYLTEFDRWLRREFWAVVLRYCDDIVILSDSKAKLWDMLGSARTFLARLDLSVKNDVQVFPVEQHGIDFMGFVTERRSVRLRKRIERSLRRSARRFNEAPSSKRYASLASYYGWTKAVSRGDLLWKRVVGRPLGDCLKESRRAA